MKKILFFSLLFVMLAVSSLVPARDACAKKLTIAINSVIMQVDPTSGEDNPSIRHNVFDQLIDIGEDGKLAAGIATWEILDEGKCYEFTLGKDIKFSSGDPLTAYDVQFSFERYRAMPHAMPLNNFDRLEVVDDHTVRFYFTQPSVQIKFLAAEASGFAVTSKDYFNRVGEKEFKARPVGTGPYKIVDWKEGQYVDLAYNENYWGEEPTVKEARLEYVSEPSTRAAMLQAGEAEIIVDAPWQNVAGLEKAGYKRTDCAIPHNQSLQFGTINPNTPWANLKVRQAINYAIDKKSLINRLFKGIPTKAAWLAPREIGYDPSLDPSYPYDLGKAKQLMKEAGYAKGFDMPVFYLTNQLGARDIADYLTNTLKSINIKCKLTAMEFGPEFMNLVRDWHTSDKAEVVLLGYAGTAYNPDPHQGMQIQFYYKTPVTFYYNPDVEAIIDKIMITPDDMRRGELIREAYRIIDADLPLIPIMQIVSVFMAKPNIEFKLRPWGFVDPMVYVKDITNRR